MKRILTIACIVIGPWAAVVQAGEQAQPAPIEFEFNPKVGDTSRSLVVVTTVGSIEMPGPMPPQKFSQTIEQIWSDKCRKVNPDKSAEYEVRVERYAIRMSMGGKRFDYNPDTYDPKQDTDPFTRAMAKIGSAITEGSFTLTADPSGRPVKFEGLSKWMDGMIKKMGEDTDSERAKGALERMRAMFDDDFMMENMVAAYRMVPPKSPARIGDTWERKWEFNLPMINAQSQGQGRYELVSVETIHGRKCAKVRFKETYRMVPKPPSKKNDGAGGSVLKSIFDRMDFETTMSGGEGIGYWDCQNGEPIKLAQTTDMTIKLELKPDPNATDDERKQGFGPMVQKLKNSVRLELLEEADATGGKSKVSSAITTAPAPATP